MCLLCLCKRGSHKDNTWHRTDCVVLLSRWAIWLSLNAHLFFEILILWSLSFWCSFSFWMCLICPKPAALSALISVIFCPFCRHTVGDTKVPFCLQSCVKPLKYAVAVNDYGTEYVHSFIGKEPSGLRFNKLFLDEDGEPFSLSPSSAAHTGHFPSSKCFSGDVMQLVIILERVLLGSWCFLFLQNNTATIERVERSGIES